MSGSPEGVYEPGVVDPGIPVPNPTKAFWQSELSAYANHQSPWLDRADIVIVGAGVSGTSLARTVLYHQPDTKIVLIDARSLCSGATGRNGGHIKTMSYGVWLDRKKRYGVEEAVRLTAFEHSHLDHIHNAIREDSINCDLLLTEGIDAYYDKCTFEKAVRAINDMRQYASSLAAQYTIYTSSDKLRQMNLSYRCVGAIGSPAASLWPYKMVTGIQEKMIKQHNLNVQTNTVVHEIQDSATAEFAVVKTSRGDIEARHVVHATNAWLGHLVPELRRFISPVRGNVTRQVPPNGSASLLIPSYSYWLRYGEKDYDYLIQRSDGDLVVGRANTGRRATGDDSETDLLPMTHLRSFNAESLTQEHSTNRQIVPINPSTVTHAWSGILGFTQDTSPFVGRLPFHGRAHQWVCGGYHGIGMIKAFRTGQMVALMVLGKEVPDEYPRSGLITKARLRKMEEELGEQDLRAKI